MSPTEEPKVDKGMGEGTVIKRSARKAPTEKVT